MVLGFVSNLLNRLKWTEKLPESEVVILHRGAPDNKKSIRGDHITEIKKGSFSFMDAETNKETYIPMHRVLEIWMDKKVVWKKRANGKAKAAEKGKRKGKAAKKIMKKKTNKTRKPGSRKKRVTKASRKSARRR